MKGRYRVAFCLTAIALLLVSISGYTKSATATVKSSSKTKKTKQGAQPESGPTYVVRKGDNLIGIARENQTTTEALKAANGLKGSRIKIGQKLIIPGSKVAAAIESPIDQTQSVQNEQVAAPHASPLQSQSQLSDDASQPKSLRPSEAVSKTQPESSQAYVVRKGDNLTRIARENGTTAKALKSANGLKSSQIKAGQKLIIPGTQVAAASKAPADTKAKSARNEEMAAQYISQLRNQNRISDPEAQPARLRLVEAGFKMLGVRYRRSGGSEKTGFDCSGLVKSLFSQFDIDLPRTSREQYKQGEEVDRDSLQVGDLVFFSSGGTRPTHVGIYVGDDKFLHAAVKARKVIVSDLNKIWYTMRYLGARRIADLWWDETETAPEEP